MTVGLDSGALVAGRAVRVTGVITNLEEGGGMLALSTGSALHESYGKLVFLQLAIKRHA